MIGLSQLLKSVAKLSLICHKCPNLGNRIFDQSELCHGFEQLWQTNQRCFHRFESILSVTYLVLFNFRALFNWVVVVVFCGCHWKTGGVVGDMCNKMALFQSLRLLLIRFNPSPVFWGNFSICYQRCWTQFLAQSQEQMALLPMTHEYDHR